MKLIFISINVCLGFVMSLIGYGFDTWQYWVALGCCCASYLVGQLDY